MTAASLSPTQVIAAAGQRLAGDMTALRDAHEVHQILPGPHDDLTSTEFMVAAELVYRETLSDDYLHRMGMTFGAVVMLMDLIAERQSERTTQLQWITVRGFYAAAGQQFAPGYEAELAKLPTLNLAAQPTPPIVRFDLLAQLASRAAVLRNLDAANWVAELADELPDLSDASTDPATLAALVASWAE